jgi:hypothetical protein
VPTVHTVAKTQLNLFRHRPDLIIAKNSGEREWYWLRNVVSGASFAVVGNLGTAGCASASDAGGVRLAFPIY